MLLTMEGIMSSATVTLDSIQIFRTHEWLNINPTVYFQCNGEKKTTLPDVKESHVQYNFKGEESWQPLTELPENKCKRCGFYEQDSVLSDDVFDEWELCPSDFASGGKYTYVKDKEFNATFSCPHCIRNETSSDHSNSGRRGNGMAILWVILVTVVVSSVLILGLVASYKYWQKRKREQDHARFLKLFEDGDDNEDELGLGDVI